VPRHFIQPECVERVSPLFWDFVVVLPDFNNSGINLLFVNSTKTLVIEVLLELKFASNKYLLKTFERIFERGLFSSGNAS